MIKLDRAVDILADMESSVRQVLEQVDRRPTVATYAQAARELAQLRDGLLPVRTALLATFTLDGLAPYRQVEAARAGLWDEIYLAPFNTIRQELLDPTSGCLRHEPQVVFIAQLLGDVCPVLVEDFLSLKCEQVDRHIDETVADLMAAIAAFRRHSHAAVVVHNSTLPGSPLMGNYEPSAPDSQTAAIRRLNRRLADAVSAVSGVYVLDFDRICAEIGYRHYQNEKLWYLGRVLLSAEALPVLARAHASFVQSVLGRQRKCLVVDLDNTLWGGVLGEDGLAGIHLGQTYPGSVYRDVQLALLQLYRRGVLLAINSKNNLDEVEEVFRSHPDMVLKRDQFASVRVNWRAKPDNMRDIAEELRIGLDSLVFLDDNPAECALMRQMLPQVLTWEGCDAKGQPDPLKVLATLRQTSVFDRLTFTDEDRRRGEMYAQQAARQQLEQSATSLDDFLRGLRMQVEITRVDEFSLPRTSELVQKTNQFNLTTRRHSAAHLAALVDNPDWGVFTVRLTDRLGDSGLVAAALVQLDGATASVDTFLLSCRVIGRTVETALLSHLVDWARSQGARALEGDFNPTAKNAPAADFYARHGFSQVDGRDSAAGSRWRLSLDKVPFEWPNYIERCEPARVSA